MVRLFGSSLYFSKWASSKWHSTFRENQIFIALNFFVSLLTLSLLAYANGELMLAVVSPVKSRISQNKAGGQMVVILIMLSMSARLSVVGAS
jgi:hypothetical protein